MEKDEAARRKAEHKAAALHNLGWQVGAGATIWARTVEDELVRHESARQRWGTDPGDLETWERLHGSALVIVVGIDQVLDFERRVRGLTGDAELAQARARFDAVVPDAEALRDLVAHLESYAAGEGRRQTGQGTPPISDLYLNTFIYWTDGGGTILNLGDQQLNLRTAADAATELAQVVERVRAKHLELAEQEARAALRRSYGPPPR